jgi:hypothetical protein
MTQIIVIAIVLTVVVTMWKAVIGAILIDKDPKKWERWQEKENERRKRHHDALAKTATTAMAGVKVLTDWWRKKE